MNIAIDKEEYCAFDVIPVLNALYMNTLVF